ncbi:MAG: acyl-CoA dehydrogenase [Candidatus Rokubacteria bacterium RIFCSPLOWO2_12_FULL_71_22]|nr:MAG: acyl-CoA dehydrogenase [Candidatus Rokubacteria bacterium RIFCSPLOWO2_12_FULL_71_22]
MDFAPSPRAQALLDRLTTFMERHVYPNERAYAEQIAASGDRHHRPQIVETLKQRAREEGLWNLFLPDPRHGPGLTNAEYAPLAGMMGRVVWASEVFNCSAPDTGNMEILAQFGTPAQQERWLRPLLEGRIRSGFSMTEPTAPGSDPTQLQTRAVRSGDGWVLTGRKWFTTGAMHASVFLVVAVSDPEAPRHRRVSLLLVPADAPGVRIGRSVPVLGHISSPGECEVAFEDVRVPAADLLGREGEGFAVAQARLGPGRIHHCMRAVGMADRAVELMARRAATRQVVGGPLAEKQMIQDFIARSRIEVEAARFLVLHAAWTMDTAGKKEAWPAISMAKVLAAQTACRVVDRAIQVHGGLGVTDDVPLAAMWRYARILRIGDGADEVHKAKLAEHELRRWR